MFQNFSKEFNTYKDTSYVNLNNGTLGLCPSRVIDQQKKELELFERNTSQGLGGAWQRIWNIQNRLANFLGGSAQDLFLRPNVTLALNEIIMGLKLPPQSEILTTNFEYGAVVNILKYKALKENLSLRIANVDFLYDDFNEDQTVQGLVDLVSEKTSVIVVSHIFTGNGLQIPLKKLAKALREKDILLVVDGAHAPGLIDLNFNEDFQDVDYYAGNLHKWMMAPKGTAFGWIHPRHQANTFPLYGSWTTAENPPVGMQAYHNHPFAERMLWSHSLDFSSYFALESCFDFWNEHGKENIFREIKLRMNYLENALSKKGIYPLKSSGAKLQSNLLCYDLECFPKANFEGLFLTYNIRLQVGLPRVPGRPVMRLTPHIHNTPEELEQAVETLLYFV